MLLSVSLDKGEKGWNTSSFWAALQVRIQLFLQESWQSSLIKGS